VRAKELIDVFAIPMLVGLGVRWAATDLGAPLVLALALQVAVQMAMGLAAMRTAGAS
jgi:hypothetical protein